MMMLLKIFDKKHIVWDKSAHMHFIKPGREALFAEFHLPNQEIDAIEKELATVGKTERTYTVNLVTKSGEVCASCEKLLYIRRK